MEGTATALSSQQILPPQQQQQQQQCPELQDILFGHLPGSLLPTYKDDSNLALTHVALVGLRGSGCILGCRMSHLLGDWSSFKLLIKSIAAAYSKLAAQQEQPQASGMSTTACEAANLVHAAPMLNQLVGEARKQLPAGFHPVRFKLLEPQDEQMFSKLAAISSSSTGAPRRLTYHVDPERIQQLKAEAAAAGSAAPGVVTLTQPWCSTHNIILARVLQAFTILPLRQQMLHDVSVAVDMRKRVPEKYLSGKQQQLQRSIGNFFASAIYEGCRGADGLPVWQLAMQLYRAVQTWVLMHG